MDPREAEEHAAGRNSVRRKVRKDLLTTFTSPSAARVVTILNSLIVAFKSAGIMNTELSGRCVTLVRPFN
ncbi:hypothetical protein M404DRAFT_999891 [Pisolithus tinctorius Marx 270]|uniref:Uncharacterized protein n=1 Tax=Pisolithus tinctorius Marx 270 TaxID=870435 RepID=A0A0C3K6T1_PISTI|nr:hypothetical protein M404DRAFT_999891 [Pisolithus tinctorius Marx 270]